MPLGQGCGGREVVAHGQHLLQVQRVDIVFRQLQQRGIGKPGQGNNFGNGFCPTAGPRRVVADTIGHPTHFQPVDELVAKQLFGNAAQVGLGQVVFEQVELLAENVLGVNVQRLVQQVGEGILGGGTFVVGHAGTAGNEDVGSEAGRGGQLVQAHVVQHRVGQAAGGKVTQLPVRERVTYRVEGSAAHAASGQAQVAGSSFGHAMAIAVVLARFQGELDGVGIGH